MKNNIIFLECTQNYGYQYSAANTKTELMAHGLWEQGDNCVIHNGIVGTSQVKIKTTIDPEFATIITYHKKGHQLFSWLFNLKRLYKDLKCLFNAKSNNILILEYADYHLFLVYVLFARLLHYKTVIISQEWVTTVPFTHFLMKPYCWIYSKTFGYFADAILPISEYIIERIRHFKTPFMKLPILANYTENVIAVTPKEHYDNYFLYCVYAIYSTPISMILNAYKQYIAKNGKQKLILILSGKDKDIAVIEEYVKTLKLNNKVIIKQKLPYDELFLMYRRASALLIPLNPDEEQDKARFSQKIAEYLSSAQPIITNNVGEIPYYFKDKENIIIASAYSVEGFCDTFKWLENDMNQVEVIGKNGYELGKQQFNYAIFGKLLHKFLLEL